MFITAIDEENNREYIIECVKRVRTNANSDDSSVYTALVLKECGKGNIKM
jgi:hypothetical protein